MRLRLLGIALLTTGLLFTGCAKQKPAEMAAGAESVTLTAPSAKVQGLIEKYTLEVVDYDYTKKAIANGTRNGALAVLIDARPESMYVKGTIPSSLNIPDTKIEQFIGQLDKVAKDKEIIVYCGGWGCAKSPKVAGYLKGKGFTNVKLYQAGEPEWRTMSYLEVGIPVVKSALDKDSALLMDARPRASYLAETIPGSLYMNDTKLDTLSARFPADKTTPIITFCGGFNCQKSHVVAEKLLELGYTDVRVFAGGLPAWKKADMRTTASSKKAPAADAAPKKDVFVDGVKAGADEGTVDGEWFNGLLASNKVPANVVLVDVRGPADYKTGHLTGAINIEAETFSADDLAAKLPKGKVVIFTCSSGARAMEAFMKLEEAGKDVSKVMYFDANINCPAGAACEVEVNEPLG